jgi:hypothetical protein
MQNTHGNHVKQVLFRFFDGAYAAVLIEKREERSFFMRRQILPLQQHFHAKEPER